MATKYCSKCDTDKPIADFYTRKTTGKPYSPCRECASKAHRRRRDRLSPAKNGQKVSKPRLTG